MRPIYVLLAGILCCFVACQKEPDSSLLTPASCKLDAIYYYDGATIDDTVGYEYTGDMVSTVNYPDYYTEISYSGDRVVRRNYFQKGSTVLAGYDDFSYNADGTIDKVDFYITDPSIPQPVLLFQYSFSYSAGKLSRVQSKVDTSGAGPEPYLEFYYAYTGDNITQVIENDLLNHAADTLNYSYDGSQNYYSKIPNLWLSDLLFADFNGYLLPFALSGNNVTALADNDGNSSTVTYGSTDKNDIESLRIDGDLLASYKYKCQ